MDPWQIIAVLAGIVATLAGAYAVQVRLRLSDSEKSRQREVNAERVHRGTIAAERDRALDAVRDEREQHRRTLSTLDERNRELTQLAEQSRTLARHVKGLRRDVSRMSGEIPDPEACERAAQVASDRATASSVHVAQQRRRLEDHRV